MTRAVLFFVFALLLPLFSGCKVTAEAVTTIKTQAASNDRYTALAERALADDADLTLKKDGIVGVSSDDLSKTPEPVRVLLDRLLSALHANRVAAYSTLFQINEGEDPKIMGLSPLELPSPPDDLLDD